MKTDSTTTYVCPVCGYPGLDVAPYDSDGAPSYSICPSCGFEYGYTDDMRGMSFEAYREKWIAKGMVWRDTGISLPPPGWDPVEQLSHAAESPYAGCAQVADLPVVDLNDHFAWNDSPCPVCGYAGWPEGRRVDADGRGGDVCACCGFNYGEHFEDQGLTFEQFRQMWIDGGMAWHSTLRRAPQDWDRAKQLKRATED